MANRKTSHLTDAHINRAKFNHLMLKKRWKPEDLRQQMNEMYGIDLAYKSLMSLLTNKASWKLLYAMAISQLLESDINYLFDIVNVQKIKRPK